MFPYGDAPSEPLRINVHAQADAFHAPDRPETAPDRRRLLFCIARGDIGQEPGMRGAMASPGAILDKNGGSRGAAHAAQAPGGKRGIGDPDLAMPIRDQAGVAVGSCVGAGVGVGVGVGTGVGIGVSVGVAVGASVGVGAGPIEIT
jgi:hypothetical protein